MKNPFYFLLLILIFLTACKQESENSKEKFPASKNEKSIVPTERVAKKEDEKLAPRIDPEKEKKYPFPYRQTKNFDEPATPVLIDDSLSSGIVFCPEVPEQDEPFLIVDEPAEFPGGKLKFLEYIGKNKRQNAEMQIQGKC